MFAKIGVSALIAGFGAGLFAAVLQFAFVQPILLHAELFETGVLTHFGAAPSAAFVPHEGGIDIIRDGLSVLFSALIYTGYAFLLLALMAFAEERGAFGRIWAMWGTAVILLAAPHIIGAPMPDTLTGPAPPELGAEFAARALGTGLAAWAMLGLLCGAVWTSKLGDL